MKVLEILMLELKSFWKQADMVFYCFFTVFLPVFCLLRGKRAGSLKVR